ncbi:MAG: hypothetical protein ACC682_03860 [Gemmatimonadota bacterium]
MTAKGAAFAIGIGASLLPLSLPRSVTAQDAAPPGLEMLPDGPGSTMEYKLERTFLKVDVLLLTVRVDRATAGRLATVLDAESRYSREQEEAVAGIVSDAAEGVAEIEFLRDVTLEQFLDGAGEDMGHARDAGWIDPDTFQQVTGSLPEWFAFLSDRGIKKGDRLTYHVLGETLRTTYRQTGEAKLSLDQTDVGQQNVMALWGGYFAPGSSFREGLTRSLWAND